MSHDHFYSANCLLTTLEIRMGLVQKYVLSLFLGPLLGIRWLAIGQFFPCPFYSPRGLFVKVNWGPVSF